MSSPSYYLSWTTSDTVGAPIDATGTPGRAGRAPHRHRHGPHAEQRLRLDPDHLRARRDRDQHRERLRAERRTRRAAAATDRGAVLAGDGLGVEGIPGAVHRSGGRLGRDAHGRHRRQRAGADPRDAAAGWAGRVHDRRRGAARRVPCSQTVLGATQLAFTDPAADDRHGGDPVQRRRSPPATRSGLRWRRSTGNVTLAIGSNPGGMHVRHHHRGCGRRRRDVLERRAFDKTGVGLHARGVELRA